MKIFKIKINNETYSVSNDTITAGEIRNLGSIPVEYEIFLVVKGHHEDELVSGNATINLSLPGVEQFYSIEKHPKVKLIVNLKEKLWNERSITFEQVVVLAFGSFDPNPNIVYTVSYDRGPHQNPEGSMVKGESVFVKTKMIFNVTATDKS